MEAANPGEVVTDTLVAGALGNSIFGLLVGPAGDATTTIEIQQHYVIVPRLVNDRLLSVDVRRTARGDAIVVGELAGRDRLLDSALQAQLELFQTVPAPVSGPVVRTHSLLLDLPSSGAATVTRSIEFDVALPADGFEACVDGFGAVVETDQFEAVENFGNQRSFDHVEERVDSAFVVELDAADAMVVSIRGDITAYPG